MTVDADVPPYTGPLISRNVAELLGIPLDDPDVTPEDVVEQ
ncbi:hypothetical protein ABZ897_00975 [Nonomuraea sp. NPDC046802]